MRLTLQLVWCLGSLGIARMACGQEAGIRAPTNTVRTVVEKPTARLIVDDSVGTIERSIVLMGTDVYFVLLSDDKQRANAAIDAAITEIRRIETMMTDWTSTSQLSSINHAAGKSPVKVDQELRDVLTHAREVSELTDGKFDVTYKGAGYLWDFQNPDPKVPDASTIREAVKRINYKKLHIDEKEGTAFLEEKGMQIGLGGIAKGYAVDRSADVIRKQGFKNFAVNAGGDLVASGRKSGKLWWVGIKDPRDSKNNIALLPVSNMAVVTSGDYERFFKLNNKRYSHIIDPDTGWPVDHCRSVTIMTRSAERADALATGVFVLGPEKGMALINGLENVEGLLVDGQGDLQVSNGLKK